MAIKKLREERGLTQTKLAQKLGVDQSTVASWEMGRICPSVKRAKLLANVFRVPLEFILAHRRTLFEKPKERRPPSVTFSRVPKPVTG